MKALILSVSAGGGHSRAAEAIKKYIYMNNTEAKVEIIDTLKYINPLIDKVIIGSYLKTIKVTPSLFGKLYNYSQSDYGLASLSSKINKILTYKLKPLIYDFKPDILIATHPFPTEMLSILKKDYDIHIPTMSIMTDYASHSFWLHPCIDAYVVSNSDMIHDMTLKGIPKNTIYNLGIPVDPDFLVQHNKPQTLRELGLSHNKTTILVMGGSLGMGKISSIYKQLLQIEMDIQIIVITGNNSKLYEELVKIQNTSMKESRIIGFTENVNKYMQICDLLLTKPGGLTITEALACKVPLGIFSPIPGQEEENGKFLLKHNLAINLKDGENCKEIVSELLTSKNKLSTMKNNCYNFSNLSSGKDIYNLISKLIHNHKFIKKSNRSFSKDCLDKDSESSIIKSIEDIFIKTAEKLFIL